MPYEQVGKNDPVCISDEVPFDIPNSWEWVHPTDIGFFSSGRTPKPDELSFDGEIPYFKVADMNTVGNEIYLSITKAYLIESAPTKIFSKNTIVFPKNGGAVFTNKKRILAQPSLVDLNTGTYTPFNEIDVKYFFYLFQTVDFQKFYKGTALPTVDTEAVQKLIWGLPPLAEQKRIVSLIEATLPLIDEYSVSEMKVAKLNKLFPDLLKKSILQEAVQGKLVPQDENDEPASVLLERIREEKARLVKEGKIKKDKNESVIFRRDNSHYEKRGSDVVCINDKIPFEIPDSWEWVRLKSICTKLVDGDHNPPKGENFETQYIMASSTNINNNRLVELNKVRYLSQEVFEQENLRTNATAGDLFFTSVGSLGRSCVYEGGHNICFQRSVSVITTLIYNYYLKLVFDSAYFQNKVIKEATGTAQKGFYLNQLSETLIPIPPISEQQQIVDFVNRALSSIEAL